MVYVVLGWMLLVRRYQRCYVLLDVLNILSLVVDLQFHAWNWEEHGVSIGLSDWIGFQTSRASWRAGRHWAHPPAC